MLLPAVSLGASKNCQPRSWQAACQVSVAPPNRTSIADLGACAPAGRTSSIANASSRRESGATSVYQARMDTFGQFLNFFGLLKAGNRQHVAVVLLQFLLQLFGQLE